MPFPALYLHWRGPHGRTGPFWQWILNGLSTRYSIDQLYTCHILILHMYVKITWYILSFVFDLWLLQWLMYFNLYLFYDCFGNKEQTNKQTIYFVLYVLVYIIIPPRFILNHTRTCATMYTTDCCLLYLIHFMYQITYNLQTCSFIDTPVFVFQEPWREYRYWEPHIRFESCFNGRRLYSSACLKSSW